MKHKLQTKLEEAEYNVYHNIEKDCLAISFVGLSQKKYIKLGMVISGIEGADKFKSIQVKEKPQDAVTQVFYWPQIQYFDASIEIKEFIKEEITEEDLEEASKGSQSKEYIIKDLAEWAYINLTDSGDEAPSNYLEAAKEVLEGLLTNSG